MSTKEHKHTGATQTASTVGLGTAFNHYNVSIAQAVDQAIHDSTKPSSEQSLLASTLSSDLLKNPAFSQLENQLGRLFNDPSANPSKGSGHDPLSDLTGAITAARSPLTSFDPANQLDPTHKPDLVAGSMPSQSELRNELTSLLGIPASALASDPSDSKNRSSGSHHPERPDGPPEGDPAGTHDPNHSRVEGMLSDGSVKHDAWDYTDKKTGDKHHTEYWMDGKGNYANYDKDLKTGVVHQEVLHPDGSGTQRTTDPHKGTSTTTTTSSDGTETTTTAITDKKVWRDGTVTISETKPGDPPLEPLSDEGSKSGGNSGKGGAKMPDGEHQTVLPAWLSDQVHKELQAEIKSMHLPTHEGDNVNVRDDVPGTVSQDDLKGATADKFHNLLGGDSFDNGGIWQDRGSGVGSLSPNYNGRAGAIDFGPDHDQLPQTSGPEERSTQHPIHTDPTAHGNTSQTGAQNNSAGKDVSPSGVIETAAQQAAHKLQDAIVGDDPWGTRGRYEQAGNRPTGLAETPTQKAAHELQDALGQHDDPNQHEPLKPHEKVPGPDLGQGPDHGSGTHVDSASGFADLIRAAQSPKEFGFAAAVPPSVSGAMLHLAANPDPANNGLGSHAVEETHVAAASIAVHDVHIDQHAVVAPVVDHISHH